MAKSRNALLYLPIFCLMTPLLINTSVLFLQIGIIASSILFLKILYDVMSGELTFNVFSVMAISILLGYGVGATATLLTASHLFNEYSVDRHSVTLWLSIALALALTFAAPLAPSLSRYYNEYQTSATRRSNDAVVLLSIFVISGYIFGLYGFGGVSKLENNKISIIGALCTIAASALPCFLIQKLLQRNNGTAWKIMLAVQLMLTLIILLQINRRTLLYSLIIALMFNWQTIKQVLSQRNMLLICFGAAGMLFVSNYIFVTFRIAHFQYGEYFFNFSYLEQISIVTNLLLSGGLTEANAYLVDSNADRALLLDFLSLLVESTLIYPPLYGIEFIESLKIATPSFTGLIKFEGDIENIAQNHFGLPQYDAANSLLTAGVSDFGILGLFLLPMFFATLYTLAISWVVRSKYFTEEVKILFVVSLIFNVINCENTVAGYISTLRDALLLSIIYSSAISIASVIRRSKQLQR